MENCNDKIKFQVEIGNVIEILSKEIYDSPYALLRENIQNAYDAILMRSEKTNKSWAIDNGKISIKINGNMLIIEDNGIGMDEETVKNNYWKAGSSGKRNELAYNAGVIGTFGIGAMSNFGVCTNLRVETKFVDGINTIISEVAKEKISLTEECISIETINDDRNPGTKIIITLDVNNPISIEQAKSYLMQYTKYLPVEVLLNDEIISQVNYRAEVLGKQEKDSEFKVEQITNGFYSADIMVNVDRNSDISFILENIRFGDISVQGEIILRQGKGYIYGLRNYFGLAPIPLNTHYGLGGVINLLILKPTAGREALSRDSIDHINQLLIIVEKYITELIAQTDFADKNNLFIQYIYNQGLYRLSGNICVDTRPDNLRIKLSEVKNKYTAKQIYYYIGRDESIINSFSSEDKVLLLLNQSNPRQRVQMEFLKMMGVEEVPDRVTVSNVYDSSDLSTDEFSLLYRIENIIREEYFIKDVSAYMADISHNVAYKIENRTDNNGIGVYLSRNSTIIAPLLRCYDTNFSIFHSIIRDFIRMNLYPLFSQYVPSASRQGYDTLRKILMNKKEEFEILYDEQGKLEFELQFEKYRSGETSIEQVLNSAKIVANIQKQEVEINQVGVLEEIIPDIAQVPQNINISTQLNANGAQIQNQEFEAMPGIMREYIDTSMKILASDNSFAQLNNFKMFLALSDKMYDVKLDFFLQPHTTKIIWAEHRIIYIFTHVSGKLTLYYDIDLAQSIKNNSTGGNTYITTTIITKNKIFVPVPEQLIPTFKVNQGSKKFFVRYDEVFS